MHIAEHLWQMSLLAGLLIVFVLILRMLLRGCSKGYSYGLWFLVLLRSPGRLSKHVAKACWWH